MKFQSAKKIMESQNIRIGIGFAFEEHNQLSDFGDEFLELPEAFPSAKDYLDAKVAYELPARKKLEEAKRIADPKVELILRQPTVDEIMVFAKHQKELPLALDLTKPEIVKIALDYLEDDVEEASQIAHALDLIEACLIGTTFEDQPELADVMGLIRENRNLSVDVTQKFISTVGK
jgi:hypothetical protein